jgi:hypothetical protein
MKISHNMKSTEYLPLRFCTAPGNSCKLDHITVIYQLHASHCDFFFVSSVSVYCYILSCFLKHWQQTVRKENKHDTSIELGSKPPDIYKMIQQLVEWQQ